MRKIIVLSMVTLDGVIQSPGAPEEDTENGFRYGGWVAPYDDEVGDKVLRKELEEEADYLLGRKTYDIWAPFWPEHDAIWPGINKGTKYVLSDTMESSDWKNTVFIRTREEIISLKKSDGPVVQVWGSSELVQLLLENDLVDELRLMIYPLTLGKGKKLFGKGTIPAAFTLTESIVTPTGVIIASYRRDGEVRFASIPGTTQ